jgi:hypothetical protein
MRTFIILLFTFNYSFAQLSEPPPNSPPQEFYDYYKLKQKKNKTTALILLGAGTIVAVGNYISYSNSTTKGFAGNVPSTSQIVIFGIGGASALASIPFFISAGKNKMKANMSLKGESITFGNFTTKNSRSVLIALTINF